MSQSHAEKACCHVTMTQCHVTMTQCHVAKLRIASSIDSKALAGGYCDVAMTRFHMEMSPRRQPAHACECSPAQNDVQPTSRYMPATQSESALEQNLTSSSRYHMVLVRYHMALLQIRLDRYFVLLDPQKSRFYLGTAVTKPD